MFRIFILTIIATLIWQTNAAVSKEYQGEENKAMFRIKDSRLSFSHQKEITIDGTGNSKNLSDYQVKLVLDSSNFDFSEAKPDGADIRFAGSDGSLFDYWIESYDSSRQNAVVWINVPKIPASSKTIIYMYYGNADAESLSSGSSTFSFYDGFEDYDAGQLVENPGQWEKYSGNPVIAPGPRGSWDETGATFASVLKDGNEYKMYYHGYNRAGSQIGLATSPDGKTFTKYGSNPIMKSIPEERNLRVPNAWKEGSTYHMIYTFNRGGQKIGHATSKDGINWDRDSNNPVFQPSETGWLNTFENCFAVMKVDDTYYMYYSDWGGHPPGKGRQIGLAHSKDLSHWNEYQGKPIFASSGDPSDKRYSQFCPNAFKYGDNYYILVPSYSSVSDYSWLYLYRAPNPYFHESEREFIRVAVTGDSMAWDGNDLDTPWAVTDDATRVVTNPLFVYYAGCSANRWHEGLTIERDWSKALTPMPEPKNTRWGGENGAEITDQTSRNGSKALKQSMSSDIFPKAITITSLNPAPKRGIIEVWIQRSSGSGGDYEIYMYGGNVACGGGFGDDGHFRYWDSDGAHSTDVTYSADTWYLIGYEFDVETDKYNFCVSDAEMKELVRINDISFYKQTSAIGKIGFVAQSNFVGYGYADDIKIRAYASTEPKISVAGD